MAKRAEGRARQKHGRWAREIARWRRSGESVRAFCRGRGLKEPSFYYWRRRLEAEPARDGAASVGWEDSAAPSTSPDSRGSAAGSGGTAPDVQGPRGPAFAELRVSGEAGALAPVVELTLPTGEQLRIGDEVSGDHLQRVLTAVREVHGC
jgi:hypothetical protein